MSAFEARREETTLPDEPEAVEVAVEELLSRLSPEQQRAMASRVFNYLTPEARIDFTAEAMGQLTPGQQPFPVFRQLARLTTLPTYEAVAIRPDPDAEDEHQLILKQRKSAVVDTPDWWEGQWHVPGAVILKTDVFPKADQEDVTDFADFSGVRGRLLAHEFGGALELTGEPIQLPAVGRDAARGNELTVREIFPVRQVGELPAATRFFNIRNVLASPLEFVETHRRLVQDVADKYIHLLSA